MKSVPRFLFCITWAGALRKMTSSMKKLVVVLAFAFIAVKMFSQDPIRFLGIPVDGTEKDMRAALKSKGFEYDSTKECL